LRGGLAQRPDHRTLLAAQAAVAMFRNNVPI
jgi:hypothetical protein